jgi:hypothetical protein
MIMTIPSFKEEDLINVEDAAGQEERTMSKEQMFTFEEYQTV